MVSSGIAPAPDEVVAKLVIVPNNPDFVEGWDTDDDLASCVVKRKVVDGIHVVPIAWLAADAAVIDINQLLIVSHHAIVGFGAVEVLDKVVPSPPFPDDVCAAQGVGLKLDEFVAPQNTSSVLS